MSASGYLFNGRTYPTETEYLAARENWQDRRQRLLSTVGEELSSFKDSSGSDGRDA